MRRRVLPIASLLLLVFVAQGCAWANRDNRPVWNAFEENLVPDDEVLLWVTAPLTIPGGLVAIVLDVFLVHPAQVLDDAWGDTTELWDDIDWSEEYYSQTAYSLIRVPGSAIMLVGSFFARSMFDLEPNDERHAPRPPRGRPAALPLDEPPAHDPDVDLARTSRLLDWFAQLLVDSEHAVAPDATPRLPSAWTDALSSAAARGRRRPAPSSARRACSTPATPSRACACGASCCSPDRTPASTRCRPSPIPTRACDSPSPSTCRSSRA